MDPDVLSALGAQISAATVAVLAATTSATQDKTDAEIAHNLIISDLVTANNLISQLRSTTPANFNLTIPAFCLTPGQISSDIILNFTNINDISIYEKSITPFKLTFDGSISNIKILVDNVIQRANDNGWNKG